MLAIIPIGLKNLNPNLSSLAVGPVFIISWAMLFCIKSIIVGGFNSSEKYDRQIGSFPQGSG